MADGADGTIGTLVEAARQGDAAAWGELVDRYSALIVAVVRSFALPRATMDDIAQTVWLRLVEHLGELRDPVALPKWIITTTRREAIRHAEQDRRTRPVDPQAPAWTRRASEDPPAEEELMRLQRHEALLAGLAELPDRQRRLLRLLVLDPPPSYAEISRRTGIPVGAIGPTRARALERLRRSHAITALLDEGEDDGPTHDTTQDPQETAQETGGGDHGRTALG